MHSVVVCAAAELCEATGTTWQDATREDRERHTATAANIAGHAAADVLARAAAERNGVAGLRSIVSKHLAWAVKQAQVAIAGLDAAEDREYLRLAGDVLTAAADAARAAAELDAITAIARRVSTCGHCGAAWGAVHALDCLVVTAGGESHDRG